MLILFVVSGSIILRIIDLLKSNSDFCRFPWLGLRFPLALRPSSVSPSCCPRAWPRSPAGHQQSPQAPPAGARSPAQPPHRLPFLRWLAQPSSRPCPPAPPPAQHVPKGCGKNCPSLIGTSRLRAFA